MINLSQKLKRKHRCLEVLLIWHQVVLLILWICPWWEILRHLLWILHQKVSKEIKLKNFSRNWKIFKINILKLMISFKNKSLKMFIWKHSISSCKKKSKLWLKRKKIINTKSSKFDCWKEKLKISNKMYLSELLSCLPKITRENCWENSSTLKQGT